MRNTIILLFLLASFSVSAQPKLLKGRIVDSRTQDGVAYTNIGVEGTFYGTASDAEGFFELKVPGEFQSEKLYVSAVGYKNEVFELSQILGKEYNLIKLVAQSYDIAGIDVAAQSRVLFRVLKSASEKIVSNYPKGPVGMKMYFSESTIAAGKTSLREAVAQVYDATGYQEPGVLDAFNNRGFKFVQAKKNFESYSFIEGSTGFEELLEMDVVRSASTILNQQILNDYDLQLEGTSSFEGDSVWIISYKTSETDLSHTGEQHASKIDGKIYISKSDYGIIRNECAIEAPKGNLHNRSLFASEKDAKKVNYHFTATYKKHAGSYALAYLDCQKTFTNAKNQQVSVSRKASVLELNPQPAPIQGRDYFEDANFVENFWRSFKKPI